MTKIDQFESVFKAADKARFVLEPINLRTVLVITDLDSGASAEFAERVRRFLLALETSLSLDWRVIGKEAGGGGLGLGGLNGPSSGGRWVSKISENKYLLYWQWRASGGSIPDENRDST